MTRRKSSEQHEAAVLTMAQQEGLRQAIVDGGLDPAACKLKEITLYSGRGRALEVEHVGINGYYSSVLTIEPSALYQTYGTGIPSQGYHAIMRVRGQRDLVEYDAFNWDEMLEYARRWAAKASNPPGGTRRTQPRPQVQQGAAQPQPLSVRESDGSNTPFSPDEIAQLMAELRTVKEELRDLRRQGEISAEQYTQMTAHFDEAEKASRHMGRKDWIMMFAGGITSLVIAGTIDRSIGSQVVGTVLHELPHLFGNLRPMLPG